MWRLPSRFLTDSRLWLLNIVATIGLMFLPFAMMRSHIGGTWLAVYFWLCMLAFALGHRFSKTELRVGADGIFIRWLRSRRFIRYEELVRVDKCEKRDLFRPRWDGLVLTLRSGEFVEIPVTVQSSTKNGALEEIEERIRAAMERRVSASSEAALAFPERGSQTLIEWVRALRSIGSGANATHRVAAVMAEQLWRVVESHDAHPIDRARAALALSGNLTEGDAARLRVVAESTAAPNVRIALEMASAGASEEELAAAMEELESEGVVRGRS